MGFEAAKEPKPKLADTVKNAPSKRVEVKKVEPAAPAVLGLPAVDKVDDNSYTLTLSTDHSVHGRANVKRTTTGVTVEIKNAIVPDKKEDVDGDGVLRGFSTSSKVSGKVAVAVVELKLKGAAGVNVAPSRTQLVITLIRPKSASGEISEKTVVVDPGHGGDDSGATNSGLQEKVYNLAIGCNVTKAFTEAGSAVVMTRCDDSYPTLDERSDMANDNEADFLISIHHNSNGLADSRSGTFTYYHNGSTEGKLLAECIQREIAAVSGLPDNGVAVDTSRFPKGGMKVLRRAKMPSVLVEVAYINNATDREKIKSEDFQKAIAKAIVKGVRDYLGDTEESP